MLEDQDWKLLSLLQQDARLSNQELADRVGMSASSCWRRVRALEDAGVIRAYRADLDAARAGLGFHAILHLTLTRHSREIVERFTAEVMRHDEVLDCYATTGAMDYHLRVLCRDLDAFNAFMERTLFRLEGIAQVQTHLVLRHVKSRGNLPRP
ncbi:MAG: Lrp/AsnC family transcriptional regulator [Rhodobacter sp.]|uniref:Lrp/AsnC family transcriptional regulator n=1 Tax=Pararhodobacter sp. TaxID=2127056 RepID=UPI001D825643|nr:Lrp/AsnC family transcriptional regulator [Pararhodobacter sp.]MCB1343937.1 Lrp/AsnC family transcriptional regulator [Paracoccaceae bacterium]MCC0074303.1 Lrp/AsnC family transcriptional regulator [Rhodobacter sp.]HPD91634.1 Lrp/AsnC family transcriptional regulator [Pararhodobacter sp.]